MLYHQDSLNNQQINLVIYVILQLTRTTTQLAKFTISYIICFIYQVKEYLGDESRGPYRSTYCETYVIDGKPGGISIQVWNKTLKL